MSADYQDPRDPYERIAANIRAEIMSGDLGPGEALPSTAKLCETYKAGNPTIQKALDVLKTEGWIVGQRGVGRRVRAKRLLVVTAGTYFDPKTTGFSYDLLEVKRATPRGDVGDALGGEAILRHRIMRKGEDPLEVEWSYYPAEIAEGTSIAKPAKVKGGVQSVLDGLGLPECGYDDIVTTRDPTEHEAQMLLMPLGVPVLRILRVTRSHGGRVIEVTVMVKAGHQLAQRYVNLPKP